MTRALAAAVAFAFAFAVVGYALGLFRVVPDPAPVDRVTTPPHVVEPAPAPSPTEPTDAEKAGRCRDAGGEYVAEYDACLAYPVPSDR